MQATLTEDTIERDEIDDGPSELPIDDDGYVNLIDFPCTICGKCEGDFVVCGNDKDGCTNCIHLLCCNPPLQEVPDGLWFCPACCSKYG